MNPETGLDLRDIHLPDAVSWWPPAIGWWLMLLLIIAIVVGLYYWIKTLRKPVLIKSAKDEINTVIEAFKVHQDGNLLVQNLSISMRRIGISYLPRNSVAGLIGQDWFEQVNSLVEQNKLAEDMIQLLSEAPYQKNPDCEPETIEILINQSQKWVASLPKNVIGMPTDV